MRLLTKLLFPPKCASCSVLLDFETPDNSTLCPDCLKLWGSERKETCGICAKEVGECSCMTERMKKAKCKGFYKLVYYFPGKRTQVQNRLIYTIKQTRDSRTVSFLASEMLEVVQSLLQSDETLKVENMIMTYIPRGSSAKLQYGTDQAKELAKALSKLLGIEYKSLLRRRWGKGKQQKTLDPVGRYRNAKLSFDRTRDKNVDLKGKTVLLVDDVVTTGAGMAICAKLLRKMGAKEVYALAVASDIFNRDTAVY